MNTRQFEGRKTAVRMWRAERRTEWLRKHTSSWEIRVLPHCYFSLKPCIPDTLTLRYGLFLSPPARVYVFWEHSPESSTDRCISSSLPTSVTKKNWRIWTLDSSPSFICHSIPIISILDMPFNTHHFNPWYAIQYPSFQSLICNSIPTISIPDMPFNTHHFNGLTESLYTALHFTHMWPHTHTHSTWTVINPAK